MRVYVEPFDVQNASTLFDIGASLAAARRARGLELSEVEARTRIRAKQLAALEGERWHELPGRAYARAFLRSYATYLDLEADLYIVEFESRFPPEDEPEGPPQPLRRRARRRYPVRVALTLASAGLVVGIVAWDGGGGRPAALPSLALPSAAEAAPAAHRTRSARHVARPKRAVDRRAVIRASRGSCWVLVRRGGAHGAVLYEGTLKRGNVIRFAARRIWIRLGAPSTVDIHRATNVVRGLPHRPTNVSL